VEVLFSEQTYQEFRRDVSYLQQSVFALADIDFSVDTCGSRKC
jgi:hypothetical protein